MPNHDTTADRDELRIDRRTALKTTAAAAALAVFPCGLRADEPGEWFFEWKRLADGVYIATGMGGNTMVVQGDGAALLVDCKNAPYGRSLRREAEKHASPVRTVVNTHHHADHTGGNHAFSADLDIIAQDNCTERVLNQLNRYISQSKEAVGQLDEKGTPARDAVRADAKEYYLKHGSMKVQQFAPKTTFAKERTIEIGGVAVRLAYFGPGHTDNDIVVFLPGKNVLHVGDLLFHKRHPYIDKDGGGNTRAWQDALRGVMALCDEKTIVIPGHGEPTGVAGLRAQVEYFDTMRAIVEKARKAGKTRKEVAEMTPGVYADYGGDGVRQIALGALYDEAR